MRILLTNDDGINASGINILADELKENGHDVLIVAPDRQQSATSHSITLHEPIRIIERGKNIYATTGTPTDCVTLASQILMKESYDLVISGINAGQNMGEDVLYSGTVAAALEGMFLGIRSIAVSITTFHNQKYRTAAFYICKLISDGVVEKIGKNEILNINVPSVELNAIKGIKITELDHRHYEDFVVEQKDPRGKKIYWIGGDVPFWTFKENSDAKAISENYISITPISPQFTKFDSINKFKNWIEDHI